MSTENHEYPPGQCSQEMMDTWVTKLCSVDKDIECEGNGKKIEVFCNHDTGTLWEVQQVAPPCVAPVSTSDKEYECSGNKLTTKTNLHKEEKHLIALCSDRYLHTLYTKFCTSSNDNLVASNSNSRESFGSI